MTPKLSAAIIIVSTSLLIFFSCGVTDKNNLSSSPTKKASDEKCPIDILKFGVCGSWLGLVTEVIGTKPSEKCCTVVKGLADLEAALCLCTAIKVNVLGSFVNNVKVPVAVSLVVNACGKKVPTGFVCP